MRLLGLMVVAALGITGCAGSAGTQATRTDRSEAPASVDLARIEASLPEAAGRTCDDAGIGLGHPARDPCVTTATRKLRQHIVQTSIQQERVRLDGLDAVDSRTRALGVAGTVAGGAQTYSNAYVASPNLSVTCVPSRAPASRAFICS